MAHVIPFTAWRSAEPELTAAPSQEIGPGLLRSWMQGGAVRRDPSAAFHVLEISPPVAPPARFVVGALQVSGAEPPPPLEEVPGASSPRWITPCLAADDRGVLDELLAEADAEADADSDVEPLVHAATDGTRASTFPVRDAGLSARFTRVLDDVLLRPLAPLPAGSRALVAVAPLTETGVRLRPWHRGLRGLEVFREERFLTVVSSYARIYELPASLRSTDGRAEAAERMATLSRGSHAVLLVLPGGRGKILRVRQALELEHFPAVPRNPTLRSVDLALLDALVFRTSLGIKEPERSEHVVPVGTLPELVARVDSGDLQAGFALHPPPLWEIRAVMEAGQSLPPRCIQVEPPLPQGLLFLDPAGSA